MPRKTRGKKDRAAEYLEKLIVLQLYALGASQDHMAEAVGKSKTWVNDLVKGLPRGGRSGGKQAKAKKARKRSRSR